MASYLYIIMAVLSVMSLNCHGFAADTVLYIRRVCKDIDVLLLQETWLSEANCSRIQAAFPEYVVFHSSAMETKLSSNIRTGRPYGGTAVLIHKRLANSCHRIVSNTPRLTAVCCQATKTCAMLFCSVYMPYNDGSLENVAEYEETIGFMQSLLDGCIGCKVIYGGDFNTSKNAVTEFRPFLDSFCSANNLCWLDHFTDKVGYTFHNSSMSHCSLIDHFICSSELLANDTRSSIHDDGDNLSDHLAISCRVSVNTLDSPALSQESSNVLWKPQWDKVNVQWYQSVVSEQLANIVLPRDLLYCDGNDCGCPVEKIDKYYSDIVKSLKFAEDLCVPCTKIGFQKHWWSPELDVLKQQCIDIVDLWKSVGKPRCGTINAERLRCKYRYKQAVKDAAYESDRNMNDDLFNHLCNKDQVSFWKAWRKRFCSRNVQPTNVLNGKSGEEILPEFTQYYKSVFQPNSAGAHNKLQDEVDAALNGHADETNVVPTIDVAEIICHINKLKRHKAAGVDDIVNEHIIFGGRSLAVHVCVLFNVMLRHSCVPSAFGHGIIIPLLKSKHGDASKLEMYRGITLSPVLSKLFEVVLLGIYREFMTSDDLQFGFKKNSSCNHALFALQESVKYYVKYGSKVFGAFLDASKAFDKVLHNCLLKKLIDRKVPLSFVRLLRYWYGRLYCCVKWNQVHGECFQILCGVRQGGVLSPYLFSLYIDDLIKSLRNSGFGSYVGNVFVGCLCYADDIVLLSPSCHGLQKLICMCEEFAHAWDIKFNPSKSQLITFGGKTPRNCPVSLDGSLVAWAETVKYLGINIFSNSASVDLAVNIRKFYSQFNNVLTVSGKYPHEMATVHLIKSYCLPTLLYGCETWNISELNLNKASVAWNNCFRHTFKGFWRESVKPLQYYCGLLPLPLMVIRNRLLFWRKMMLCDNAVLVSLSRLIARRFIAEGSRFGVSSWITSPAEIKTAVWSSFANTLSV